MRPVGLVLAAGSGERFGGPKAPFEIDGRRLVDRAVTTVRAGGCDPVVVVLGAWVGEVPGAITVVNRGWRSGMASSLQVGLSSIAAITRGDRALITLVDLPGMTPAGVRRVAESTSQLATATYRGKPGHPVLLHQNHWVAISSEVTGDHGARDYLERHTSIVSRVEVGDVTDYEDLDYRNPR